MKKSLPLPVLLLSIGSGYSNSRDIIVTAGTAQTADSLNDASRHETTKGQRHEY